MSASPEYVAGHRDADTTSRLNAVLAEASSDIDPVLRRAQARSVRSGKWLLGDVQVDECLGWPGDHSERSAAAGSRRAARRAGT